MPRVQARRCGLEPAAGVLDQHLDAGPRRLDRTATSLEAACLAAFATLSRITEEATSRTGARNRLQVALDRPRRRQLPALDHAPDQLLERSARHRLLRREVREHRADLVERLAELARRRGQRLDGLLGLDVGAPRVPLELEDRCRHDLREPVVDRVREPGAFALDRIRRARRRRARGSRDLGSSPGERGEHGGQGGDGPPRIPRSGARRRARRPAGTRSSPEAVPSRIRSSGTTSVPGDAHHDDATVIRSSERTTPTASRSKQLRQAAALARRRSPCLRSVIVASTFLHILRVARSASPREAALRPPSARPCRAACFVRAPATGRHPPLGGCRHRSV